MKKFNFGFFFYFTFIFSETIDVTFRYVKHPDDDFIRIFVPGTMPEGTINDWGPNSNGVISPNAQSLMNCNSDNQS